MLDLPERILRRVEITESCWLWTGSKNRNGYGYTRWKRGGVWKHARVHRIFYEAAKGPIPDGLQIDHRCRVQLCVNPDHLAAVTYAENMLNRIPRGPARKHACMRGHVFTDASTYVNSRGDRSCRICRTEAVRRWRAR